MILNLTIEFSIYVMNKLNNLRYGLMDKFLEELESGAFQLRDKWQLELKSEFFPLPTKKKNSYTQEFYIFIPNSLQINEETYTKKDFFLDQTNFIRYKTPVFTFDSLLDSSNTNSPFVRINRLINETETVEILSTTADELKLLGNIVRSILRKRILLLSKLVTSDKFKEELPYFTKQVQQLSYDLEEIRHHLANLKSKFFGRERRFGIHIRKHFLYVDEFISLNIHHYLTKLLERLQNAKVSGANECKKIIKERILCEFHHREEGGMPSKAHLKDAKESEFIHYRSGLLNKFVLDALLLNTSRSSPDKRLKNVIGALAAGIAMMIYFLLFVWQGEIFIINSEPFILATVVLYILKDRIKEGIKVVSYRCAFKWFSDYKTEIRSFDNKQRLGVLKEFFSYIETKELPNEIVRIRNKEFHYVLEDFHRPEKVIFYKKTIEMDQLPRQDKSRRYSLNLIFRFNILRFLAKADNPYQKYLTLDEESKELKELELPKTYHVNIIMKNSFMNIHGELQSELKKFRLIIDKNGIKRIEQVR